LHVGTTYMRDSNPLQTVPAPPLPTSEFYKIDSTRVSLREYWWGARSAFVFLIACCIKLLRIRLPSSADDPNVESLHPFEMAESSFPEDVRTRLAPLTAELQQLGFHSPAFHAIEDAFHRTTTYLVTLRHTSGEAFGRIHHRIWTYPHPAKVSLFAEFVSAFEDGSFLWSLASKPDMQAPPSCRTNRRVGASATALWSAHLEELGRARFSKAVVPMRTTADLVAACEHHHRVVRDFHLRRGVFVPMTAADVEQTVRLQQRQRAAETAGLQHSEVLAELDRMERTQTSWTNTILVLLVSLGLFLGAGSSEWKATLILVPILLFHECGHYVAMRVFRYRNLRMFFIPFFGAAVAGRHYNVPGWKKAVVFLMGPVPGILVGAVMGAIGILLHKDILLMPAAVMLMLNGFNLLPILPLDGGWVLHTLLFSRHYILDVVFRFLAAAALVAASRLGLGPVLIYLAIFLLIGASASYRLARIAHDLRKSGMPPLSPDDQTIPPEIAQAIIPRVKAAFPKRSTAKVMAQYTLQVFETINARPPGWAATIGLGTIHGFSIVIALVGAILFALGPKSVTQLVRFYRTPRASLEVAAIASVEALSVPTSASYRTIIATFDEPAAARASFQGVKPRLAPTTSLRLFGQSLILSVPAGDPAEQQWSRELQPLASDVLLDTPDTQSELTLTCVAPGEAAAKAIEEETLDFFRLPSTMHLIPPWVAPDLRSVNERAQHRLARQTYLKLRSAGSHVFGDPVMRENWEQIRQARRQGDRARADQLQAQNDKLLKDAERRDLEQFRAQTDDSVDTELVSNYIAITDSTDRKDRHDVVVRQLAPRMGQLPLADDRPLPDYSRYAVSGALPSRRGLLLRFDYLRFADVCNGPTALANWLDSQGCASFHYEFYPHNDSDSDDAQAG
jgi:Zn-dependent protease